VTQHQKPGGYSYKISSYLDGHSCRIGERVLIHGMNHFWPGGSSDPQWHSWTDPKGPSGAELAWSFVSSFRKDDTAWSCRPQTATATRAHKGPQPRHKAPPRHHRKGARRK
jgi:hypothetical protein